jgi:hypothetical protein
VYIPEVKMIRRNGEKRDHNEELTTICGSISGGLVGPSILRCPLTGVQNLSVFRCLPYGGNDLAAPAFIQQFR